MLGSLYLVDLWRPVLSYLLNNLGLFTYIILLNCFSRFIFIILLSLSGYRWEEKSSPWISWKFHIK